MSSDDKMSIEERRKYLRRTKKRYTQATRKERGQLLDEMEAVTELHRKSLIWLMKDSYRAAHEEARAAAREAEALLRAWPTAGRPGLPKLCVPPSAWAVQEWLARILQSLTAGWLEWG